MVGLRLNASRAYRVATSLPMDGIGRGLQVMEVGRCAGIMTSMQDLPIAEVQQLVVAAGRLQGAGETRSQQDAARKLYLCRCASG